MDLTDRIAAHPVRVAYQAYLSADAALDSVEPDGIDVVIEHHRQDLRSAEAALTAALDAEDARREDFAVMYQILDQMFATEQWRERFRIRPVPWNDDTVLVARDVQKAEDIDRWKAAFSRIIDRCWQRGDDMGALIGRSEGTHVVAHERPDEPAGLTPCCGKTEPRITSEGGVLVDEPGAVTCPGEED